MNKNTVNNYKINRTKEIIAGLPSILNYKKQGFTIDTEYLQPEMEQDQFQSVILYLLETINAQILPKRKSAPQYLQIKKQLESLLPEENLFGAGLSKKAILNQIYQDNQTTH